MPSLSTKERKAKFNTDDMVFRKKSNLSTYVDTEYNSAESLTNTNFFELNQNEQLIL